MPRRLAAFADVPERPPTSTRPPGTASPFPVKVMVPVRGETVSVASARFVPYSQVMGWGRPLGWPNRMAAPAVSPANTMPLLQAERKTIRLSHGGLASGEAARSLSRLPLPPATVSTAWRMMPWLAISKTGAGKTPGTASHSQERKEMGLNGSGPIACSTGSSAAKSAAVPAKGAGARRRSFFEPFTLTCGDSTPSDTS